MSDVFSLPNSLLRNIVRIKKSPLLNSPFELNFLSKHSFRGIRMGSHQQSDLKSDSRGAFIVLEGLDRCGKTSQCARLLSTLEGLGYSVESWRFPDRNTGVGKMISSYLSNQSQLDDHAIHLLFSANRWEKRSLMEAKLMSGTTVIVDRYSYSGVAFSSAKGLDFQLQRLGYWPQIWWFTWTFHQRKLLKEEVMEVRDMSSLNFRRKLQNLTSSLLMVPGR